MPFQAASVATDPLQSGDGGAARSQPALTRFQDRFGVEATHLVHAPGRVNLIGEHTDYNGGFVLPLAIELGVQIAARPNAQPCVRLWSAQCGGDAIEIPVEQIIERGAPAWSNYVRGVLAGLQGEGVTIPGFDAVIDATLPAGGGLSSSAALEVATATLVETLAGVTLDPVRKALICQRAEHDFAGTPCGIMDQFAVIFGKRGHLLLLDCQTQARKLVPMREGASLLVVNTMVKHELTDGGYASRRDDCYEAARILGVKELRDATPALVEQGQPVLTDRLHRRARHVVLENERTLSAVAALQIGAWAELGALMYASHASLRDDFEVSCEELDAVVHAAEEIGSAGGVHGCRMTGGGFGGCCVALVETGRAEEVGDKIRTRYREATGIEPTIFATQPADGPAVLLKP